MKINPTNDAMRRLFFDADTQGLVLYLMLLHIFGDAVHGDPEDGVAAMDPAEMWSELAEIFGDYVPEENENRINAVLMAVDSDLFYSDQLVFASVVNALYDGDLGDLVNQTFEDPSAIEVLWSVIEVELIRDESEGTPNYGRLVQSYMQEIFEAEQEEWEGLQEEVDANYEDMIQRLRSLGVTEAALSIMDKEFESARYIEDDVT